MKIIKPRKKKIKKEKIFSFLKEICEKTELCNTVIPCQHEKNIFQIHHKLCKKYHSAVVFSCRRRKYVLRRPLPGEWDGGNGDEEPRRKGRSSRRGCRIRRRREAVRPGRRGLRHRCFSAAEEGASGGHGLSFLIKKATVSRRPTISSLLRLCRAVSFCNAGPGR